MGNTNISAGTVARTLVLLLALINQGLYMAGRGLIPIEDEAINALVANAFTIGAALITWWKNNSFTQAAQTGDATMKKLKAARKR